MPRLVRFLSTGIVNGVFHWFGKRRGRPEVVAWLEASWKK